MKAVLFKEFGPSAVLSIGEFPRPPVGPSDILIRLEFTSVNPVDWKIRLGHLKDMLPHNLPAIPGWDAAGVVEETGSSATRFKKGDRVYAYARRPEVKFGTYAEFVAVDESAVALAPTSVGLEESAAVPLVALTAWQALYDFAKVRKSELVLVIGAAGGVGGFAIQLAKLRGARVIALARPNNHSYVSKLGADFALDYTRPDILEAIKAIAPNGIDVVFDGAGGTSLELGWSTIRRGGRLVSIVETPDASRSMTLQVSSTFVFVAPNGEQLRELATLIDEKRIKLPEIRLKNISEAAAAMDTNMGRQERGKTVLAIQFM